jgi:hypothetical protein
MSRSFRSRLGFVVLAGCALAFSQAQAQSVPKRYPWDQRMRKCFLPGAEVLGKQCQPNDWPTYNETSFRVQTLLGDPDFDLIERAENDLGFSTEKFPRDPHYYFEAWYSGLDFSFVSPGPRHYSLLDGWAKAKGTGGYFKLAEALLHYREGWAARGSGMANTVLPEAWEIYRRKIREADQILDSAPQKLKRTGPWHVLKLHIAYQLPELKESREKLLDAASNLWPDSVHVYGTAMWYALPKWGGTYREVDRVAHIAYEKTQARTGASLYAWVYRLLVGPQCGCTLADTAVDWALMKRGLRDIEAQGGGDAEVWNGYATLACQMRDRPEAQRLLELSDKLRADRSPGPPNPCREFAFSAT